MLRLFRKSLKTGIVTTAYPAKKDIPKEGFRGLPERKVEKCTGCGHCSEVCPTGAIEVTGSAGQTPAERPGFTWALDPKRCLFCGYCAEDCPEGALQQSQKYELAINATSRALGEQLGRSIHIRHLDGGSCNGCEWEMTTLTGPVYDIQRLGFDFVASPRHADLLMVTGPITRNLELAVRRTFSAVPAPKVVLAVGTCACSGGMCGSSYASAGGVDQVLPVDVYIPGCPPRPQALIQGLLQVLGQRGS